MTRSEINAALASANPLTDRTCAELPLRRAELELIERIVAVPVSPRSRRDRPAGILHRRPILAFVAAAVIAAVLTVVPLGNQSAGPAPAFAASLVRFANNSPLVLLRLPGWHVVYTVEQPGGYGEMHFVRGPADAQGNPRGGRPTDESSVAGRVAQLTWYPTTPAIRKYIAAGHEALPTGLDVTARRLVGEGSAPGWVDVSAFLIYRGRELHFRATVRDFSMFRQELRDLTAVDTTTWLRAMPPSVINSAESNRVVHQMLRGIPLPPGFNAARIRGSHLVQNRYDLGVAVTGTVACMWIADWNHARHDGDRAMVTRAIAAMATSPQWPILHQMSRQGAWPQVLIQFAHDMRRGTAVGGRVLPLTVDANSGLGCSELGIDLGS